MGKDPLAEREDIAELRNWLERAGVNRVYDLASWDERGEWLKWDFHGVPERLKDQQIQLENLLEDATPDSRFKRIDGVGESLENTPQQRDISLFKEKGSANILQPFGSRFGSH